MATLPAYLVALTGKGVHIVTVNDYLAKRDAEWMGKIYDFSAYLLGLRLGHDSGGKSYSLCTDVTYGTNNEYGFDYLRDNMVTEKEQKFKKNSTLRL